MARASTAATRAPRRLSWTRRTAASWGSRASWRPRVLARALPLKWLPEWDLPDLRAINEPGREDWPDFPDDLEQEFIDELLATEAAELEKFAKEEAAKEAAKAEL